MSLWISKQLLDCLGASINVESKKEIGSNFIMNIPLEVVPEGYVGI